MPKFCCRFGHSLESIDDLLPYANWKEWASQIALQRTNGDMKAAAKLLGVAKSTFWRWCQAQKKGIAKVA